MRPCIDTVIEDQAEGPKPAEHERRDIEISAADPDTEQAGASAPANPRRRRGTSQE